MKKKLRSIEPYIWILPSVLLMAVFIVVPIGFVFRMSFSKISKAGLIKGFCGFDNFQKVLGSPAFSMVLKNTIVWTVAVVGLSTILGFILAIVLNNNFKGRKIARAVIVFPWATTLIIQASIWKFIIDTDYGTLNTLLLKLGIIDHAINRSRLFHFSRNTYKGTAQQPDGKCLVKCGIYKNQPQNTVGQVQKHHDLVDTYQENHRSKHLGDNDKSKKDCLAFEFHSG